MTNRETEIILRQVLEKQGFELNPQRVHGEHGVDILAKMDDRSLHIECIGYKKSGSARAKDFFEGFFRSVSRLNDDARECIIALPSDHKIGINRRVSQHRVAWERIGRAFPELKVWFVNSSGSYDEYGWNDLFN
jgi:hypothetical protein